MKKRIKLFAILITALSIALLSGCGGVVLKAVDAPSIVLNGENIEWTEVKNAETYVLSINGTEAYSGTDKKSFSIAELNSDAESFSITVRVIGQKGYGDSVSDTLIINRIKSPEVYLSELGGVEYLGWYNAEGATKYTLKIDDKVTEYLPTDTLKYQIQEDDYSVELTAIADSKYYIDSNPLEVSLISEKLSAPKIKQTGALLNWNKVKNAIAYEVYVDDVLKSKTTSTQYLFTEKTDTQKVYVKAKGLRALDASQISNELEFAVDEVSIITAAIENASNYKALKIDVVGTAEPGTMAKQQTKGARIFNFGKDLSIVAVSKGTLGAAINTYYNTNETKVNVRRISSNNNISSDLTVDWSGAKREDTSKADFISKYKRQPFDFMLYTINYDTVNSVLTELNYDGSKFTFKLDMKLNAVEINRIEVMDIGGLSGCDYISCELEFEVSSDMKLLYYKSNDYYAAQMGLTVNTRTINEQTFTYYNEYQDVDSSWI